ncbi:MAG: hypothetical protein EZS28_037621, partial [Streblomastix strix]
LEIDPVDPDQTVALAEKVPPNATTAARVLLAGLSGQKTSQIDFYTEELSEKQVIEARLCARAGTDLLTCRKPSKHNNPPAQPMLAFDQFLADLETKLLQQYRLLQGTLTQIHIKHDLQGKHIASADGYDETREPVENATVTNNTSQLNQNTLLNTQKSFTYDLDLCIVIEFCSGGNLHVLMEAMKKMSIKDRKMKCYMPFYQMLSSLVHIHSLGIVHNDLKPENVLLDENGNTKTAVFGLSQKMASKSYLRSAGTVVYAPSEAHTQNKMIFASDIWVLALIVTAVNEAFILLLEYNRPVNGSDRNKLT